MGSKCGNEKALELCATTCENLGYTLGKEVSLGVDFASSTQWDEKNRNMSTTGLGLKTRQKSKLNLHQILLKNTS